jgi:AcrR family transcriptional regulator
MKKAALSPTRHARRARIIAAAETVFRNEGFRGATMERIAEAAGMSKVTLYGYFPDKEAAFLAVAESFSVEIERRFFNALNEPGALEPRVTAALMAKHGAVHETVRSSAQSRDIFAARDRIAAATFDDLDERLLRALMVEMETQGLAEPEALARILFRGSLGIANASRKLDELAGDIAMLTSAVLQKGKPIS